MSVAERSVGADGAEEELSPELVLEIAPPLVHKGGTYDSLTLREPKGIEVRQAEMALKAGVNVVTMRAYQIALVARVSGIPEPLIEQLPIRTLNRASRYLQSFIEGGAETGGS